MRLNKSAERSRSITRPPMISCCPPQSSTRINLPELGGESRPTSGRSGRGKDHLCTLVEGNGSTDNANFVLELSGTLRSATTFDFGESERFSNSGSLHRETSSAVTKRKLLKVKVTDCFVPVVETLSASEVQASSAKTEWSIGRCRRVEHFGTGFRTWGRSLSGSWPSGRLGHCGSTFRKLRGIRWPSQQPVFDGQILSAGLREELGGHRVRVGKKL